MKPDDLNLPPDLVERYKREKARLEQDIAEAQRKLVAVNQVLRAALVLGEAADSHEESEAEKAQENQAIDPENVMGTMAALINQAPKPLTKPELKAQLHAVGVPDERLGSYFYVAIKRLKDHERIKVLDDGRVWRR
jgi:hypothetical protein